MRGQELIDEILAVPDGGPPPISQSVNYSTTSGETVAVTYVRRVKVALYDGGKRFYYHDQWRMTTVNGEANIPFGTKAERKPQGELIPFPEIMSYELGLLTLQVPASSPDSPSAE